MSFRGLLGIACILLIAWLVSEKRRGIHWRLVSVGIALQFVLALLLIKLPPSKISLGLKSIVAGVLANCMTGAVAGLLH